MSGKFQYVCWTLNNYEQEEIDFIKKKFDEKGSFLQYVVFGKEEAETTGTRHLQGYLQTKRQVSQAAIKKIIPRAKLLVSKASLAQYAADYCKKGIQSHAEWEELKKEGPNYGRFADVTEWGTMKPGQGRRTDLIEIKKKVIEERMPINEVVVNYCENYQQARYAELLYKYIPLSTEYKPKEVYWFWGPTGTGKTREAYKMAHDRGMTMWISGKNDKWIQKYWGQKLALIDDVRAGDWYYTNLLRLTDGYEKEEECKGSSAIWHPEVIVITSPYPPEECYKGQVDYRDHINQLLRRIIEIREFRYAPGEEPKMARRTVHVPGGEPILEEEYERHNLKRPREDDEEYYEENGIIKKRKINKD